MQRTYISEIFSSIQGEGLLVGVRQIFVRFTGCNLNCKFCDTDYEQKPNMTYEKKAGSGVFEETGNPVSVEFASGLIDALNIPPIHHSVSITGGEPLLHVGFLKELLPEIRKKNLLVFLETAGTLYNELREIIGFIDGISMDIKLPSTAGTQPLWEQNREFLKVASDSDKELFIKIVVDENTADEDLRIASELVKDTGMEIHVIIQPVITEKRLIPNIPPERLFQIQQSFIMDGHETRIIPQVHKLLRVR